MDADWIADISKPCPLAVGTRIRLVAMPMDPDPVPVGTEGIVTGGNGAQIWIDWDNGRGLGLIPGIDQWEVVMASEIDHWPNVTIPDHFWEASGEESDPTARLSFAMRVNGRPMHLEAHAVHFDEEGTLITDTPYPDDYAAIEQIANPDGPFLTWTINGREYVLVAFPFC